MGAPMAAIWPRSRMQKNGNDGRCPDGLPTYPTPNGSNSASRSGQNGGSNQSRTRLVTELLRCDGIATPEGNPAKTGGFIRLGLMGRYLNAPRPLERARARCAAAFARLPHTAMLHQRRA